MKGQLSVKDLSKLFDWVKRNRLDEIRPLSGKDATKIREMLAAVPPIEKVPETRNILRKELNVAER